MFLLSLLIASATAIQYTCGPWTAVNATTYTATGSVSVFDNSTGAYFLLTGASLLSAPGVRVTNAVVAHLHAAACAMNDAGPHFKKNVSETATILANELWASPNTDGANPAVQPASGTWDGFGSLPGFSFAGRTDVKAIIIHEYPNTEGTGSAPKRVCCDLSVVAETTAAGTTGAGTTGAAAGTTTPAAGTTDAGTTGAGTTGATAAPAAACTTNDCCDALGKKTRGCTDCLGNAGCEYFGTLKNDLLDLGGKCVLKGETSPVGTRKVAKADECLDTCSGYSCTDCLKQTGCKFCDSLAAAGEKVGTKLGSTGTCEKAKCGAGEKVEVKTADKCSASASILSAVAVVLSVALSL